MKIKADIPVIDILGHVVLWIILGVITLGIALFFFPYSFSKFIINRTSVVEIEKGVVRRLKCEIDLFANIGHVIIWILITIVTLGLGYIFYFYRVWNYALNNMQVESTNTVPTETD